MFLVEVYLLFHSTFMFPLRDSFSTSGSCGFKCAGNVGTVDRMFLPINS